MISREWKGEDELPGKIILTGNDPDNWRINIPTYRQVHYKQILSRSI